MSLADRLLDTRPLRTSAAFRRLWAGSVLSALGGQLTVVAVLFQMWELTGSALAVGAIGLVQSIAMVFFGVLGGALADAVDRRRLVLITTVVQLLAAGLLAVHAASGAASMWGLLALTALQTAGSGLGAPARKTFVVRLLPADQVGAGIALTNLAFQAAMLIGPAIAGVVVGQWGVGACYLLDALTFAAALYGVQRLPAMRPQGETARPGARAIWEGCRFITGKPLLHGALLSDVLATVTAMPMALFPLINSERFGGHPETLGLFFSAVAVGGLAAGAASGMVTRARRPGAVMLAAAGAWGLALAGFGLAQPLWLALTCLAAAGAADTTSVITRGAIVQLATPDSHRGRVSAVDHIVGVSGPDLGNFRGGLVADATSAAFAAFSGGVLCVVGIVVLALTNRSLRRFETTAPELPGR
ncbi:Predicted arabinose efflux permease, MFS family [Saccharopolyspora shandongensis]|uniref:Predicted arabinose efflux permease, MFS family n=1 Tax=Saccharopolyspora shandongensis TaxID=418495 RepID=A0A1H3GNX7_9PSEU|nr:MFS transporter [Saccharopolyspora shandongensis]SDY04675.1 Predicted arabinose efflux permease, MFS family [Saccharopolyspora shandongensis]